MFGKFMNNYYYGKSGKGDYNPEDLPHTRWQLFWEMLRTRVSALCRLNLIYVLPWLPTIIVLAMLFTNTMSTLNEPELVDQMLIRISTLEVQADGSVLIPAQEEGGTPTPYTKEQQQALYLLKEVYSVDEAVLDLGSGAKASVEVTMADGSKKTFNADNATELYALNQAHKDAGYLSTGEQFLAHLFRAVLLLIPCIFITGPWTAGVAYVTRNWARDEHAFLWSDCKDAMKENWKGSLVLSAITAVVPVLVYLCWTFYVGDGTEGMFMSILLQLGQMIPLMVGVIWYLAITYAYPMLVTYDMKVFTVIRNSLILAVGRLPQSVGVRLLLCVPAVLGVLLLFVFNSIWVPLGLMMYYVLFGFTFSRFITASYTNAQFDRFINSRIEGAKVNQGLAEEDEEYEEEEEEEREIKPWENGYANRDDA